MEINYFGIASAMLNCFAATESVPLLLICPRLCLRRNKHVSPSKMSPLIALGREISNLCFFSWDLLLVVFACMLYFLHEINMMILLIWILLVVIYKYYVACVQYITA